MRQNVLDALVDLFGDEERALAFAEGVDETNRGITDEGLIARAKAEVEGEAEPDAEPVEAAGDPDAEPGEGEPEPTRELELDDAAMDAITGRFAEMLEPFTERIDSLSAQLGELTEAQTGAEERAESTRESLNLRLKRLERTDEEKHTEWAADLPRAQKLRVTYRPREANEDRADGEPDSLADVANATLEKMPRY